MFNVFKHVHRIVDNTDIGAVGSCDLAFKSKHVQRILKTCSSFNRFPHLKVGGREDSNVINE